MGRKAQISVGGNDEMEEAARRGRKPKFFGCTECDNPKHYALGLCRKHYDEARYVPAVVHEPKMCECGKKAVARGMCKNHYNMWWYNGADGNPIRVDGRYRELVRYLHAHNRVRRARGRADLHLCVMCNQQADAWALMGTAKNLVTEPEGRYKGTKYSLDPNDYQPMCQACHKAYDATEGHRKGVGGRKKKVAA